MPKFKIKSDSLTLDVEKGKLLKDLCDENGSSIPFGCRNGVCGTCLSTVLEGADNLEPAAEDEKLTLESFGVQPPNKRLVCQCKFKGPGDVEIENP